MACQLVWHDVRADHAALLTRQLRVSYPRWAMAHPTAAEPLNDPNEPGTDDPAAGRDLSAIPTFLRGRAPSSKPAAAEHGLPGPVPQPMPVLADALDPAALRMASLSPRRLLQVVAVVAIAWGVVSFGRQVASASAASAHAATLRGANTELRAQVTAMQSELALIQERRYIDQQARAYRLGSAKEVPFALEAGAPALPADAPGSAATRLGAPNTIASPLEHWLALLFGTG